MEASMELARRAQAFLEGLGTLETLDAVTNLACSLLGAPLFLCDAGGGIWSISPPELRDCPAWTRMVRTRRVEKDLLREALSPSSPKVWAGLTGRGRACRYLSVPTAAGGEEPGALCVFAWLRDLTQEDAAFARLAAGSIWALVGRRFAAPGAPRSEKVRLLRELLDYKPGLKSYFERGIAQQALGDLPGAFRTAYLRLDDGRRERADGLLEALARRLPGAWAFAHEDGIVCVLNEALVAPPFAQALDGFLEAEGMTGCLSMRFQAIIDLRYTFENARAAWLIASRTAPGGRLYRAEDYLCYTFLYKCQRYFPIEEHCSDGFRRLVRFDQENGRDYLATLSAYLDNGLNANATAKELFIHRNTLTQRLEKIGQILDVPLEDREARVYLQLCLRIHALQNI